MLRRQSNPRAAAIAFPRKLTSRDGSRGSPGRPFAQRSPVMPSAPDPWHGFPARAGS